MKLVIGNKNYSSWSLRPWFLLKEFGIAFDEIPIPLSTPETAEMIAQYNPAGKVPVLYTDDWKVWDSLAICEFISEHYLDNKGWPEDVYVRAEARSCCAEMHSGFFALRNDMPMNCRAENRVVELTPSLIKDIERIDTLWKTLREKYGHDGQWLFGKFSIADAMFAPVVFRFNTYAIPVLNDLSLQYMNQIFAHPAIQEWLDSSRKEKEIIAESDVG